MAEELKKTTRSDWARFLAGNSGIEVMLYLREREPRISGKEGSSIVFEAGVSEGYRRALDLINSTINTAAPTREVDYEN